MINTDKSTTDEYVEAIAASMLRGAVIDVLGGDATAANLETEKLVAFTLGRIVGEFVRNCYINKDAM